MFTWCCPRWGEQNISKEKYWKMAWGLLLGQIYGRQKDCNANSIPLYFPKYCNSKQIISMLKFVINECKDNKKTCRQICAMNIIPTYNWFWVLVLGNSNQPAKEVRISPSYVIDDEELSRLSLSCARAGWRVRGGEMRETGNFYFGHRDFRGRRSLESGFPSPESSAGQSR